MTSQQRNRDEGAVLVVVLLFVLVVALVITAILDQVRASVGNTVIVRNQQALTYSADAGIELGMQAVRRDSRLCGTTSVSPTTVGTYTVNGRSVTVTCQGVAGASKGILGYAVVTLDDSGNSLTTQGGGTKKINGPVWTGQLDSGVTDLVVEDGDVVDKHDPASGSGSCSLGSSAPAGLTVQPTSLYSYSCSTQAPPAFSPTLPTVLPAPGTTLDVGTCRTFTPGLYTSATWPGLLAENYFVSGVYVLQDVNLDVSGGKKLVGGNRASSEQPLTGLSGCANDSVLLPTVVAGTGVKVLLGGSSRISVSSSAGNAAQLFARQGGTSAEGTQGISVMQIRGSTVLPNSTLGVADDILTVSSGSNPNFAVHGIVHVPSGRVNVDNASAGSSAAFRGGMLTGRLHMQNSGSSTGLVVSIDVESSVRTVQLVATTRLDAGDKPIVATAVVDVDTDNTRRRVVQSWRSTS